MQRTTIRSKSQQLDQDEDLEKLQSEFLKSNQTSSATVIRKAAPSFGSSSKKPSLFAQRRAAAAAAAVTETTATATQNITSQSTKKRGISITDLATEKSCEIMPDLETMPSLDMPTLDKQDSIPTRQGVETTFEPLMDPHHEPHMPAVKKMLDLTSMLGSVLGQVTEHTVDKVTAPTLTSQQQQGFPQAVHRSVFKERHTVASPTKSATPRDNSQPVDYQDENSQRIAAMTDEEIQAARDEILGSLSPSSIAFLQRQQKPAASSSQQGNKPSNYDTVKTNTYNKCSEDEENDILAMKEKYFADVPLEGEKLAWMDDRFKAYVNNSRPKEDTARGSIDGGDDDNDAGNIDPVYRQLRFDLQGHIVDPYDTERQRQQELHHHGDKPDQAGYTLAELFYLVRSQVPSQRALILNILTRILEQAKLGNNKSVLQAFQRRDIGAVIYFRSALDDRHLAVIVSAIQALLALVTIDSIENDRSLGTFNTWLGHVAQPQFVRPQPTTKKWVQQMKLNSTANGNDADTYNHKDDAGLAEQDMVQGLIQTDVLARLRYLMAVNSEVRTSDDASMERMVEMLIYMAEAKGQPISEMIADSGVLDLAVGWVDDQEQGTLTEGSSPRHRLCVLRLITAVVQGSKKAALELKDKVTTITLPWLATVAVAHTDYQVQIETIKLLRVLACYGLVVPTLQDLQDTMMGWITLAVNSMNNSNNCDGDTTREVIIDRAATVIGLMEVLLHAAADPHKTLPAHAVNWHQPTAFVPLIIALLCEMKPTTTTQMQYPMLHGCCLGYLTTWTSYLDKFPPESNGTLQDIWHLVQRQEITRDEEGKERSSHWILRYMQLCLYFTKWDDKNKAVATPWITTEMIKQSQQHWSSLGYLVEKAKGHGDFYGRMVYYLSYKVNKNNDNDIIGSDDTVKLEKRGINDEMMEMVVSSLHAGVVERWLARALLQMCVLSQLDNEMASMLEPFYMNQGGETKDIRLGEQLMALDGRDISTLCYPRQKSSPPYSIDAWLLSPIDEMYYWDKSRVTQQLLRLPQQKQEPHGSTQQPMEKSLATTAAAVTKLVIYTFKTAWQLYRHHLDHNVLLVTLMKVFLVGDREGQTFSPATVASTTDESDVGCIREIFWDASLSNWMDKWMDVLESSPSTMIIDVTTMEQAWSACSNYTLQAHVPFYQFYQSFLSQYASVSLGHRVYSRVLAFVATKLLGQVDYRHLLLSDYQDILVTLERQGYHIRSLLKQQT